MKGIVIIIASILVMALIASFPVWKQNKYHDIQKESTRLAAICRTLESELQKKEFKINTLQSRQRIEQIAAERGLGFHSTYTAVIEK
jgi:cell division protein FtsL